MNTEPRNSWCRYRPDPQIRYIARSLADVLLCIGLFPFVTACDFTRSSESLCWSTSTLRVAIGSDVLNIPASAKPTIIGDRMSGAIVPAYSKPYDGVARLNECQDKRHVPLKVTGVFVHPVIDRGFSGFKYNNVMIRQYVQSDANRAPSDAAINYSYFTRTVQQSNRNFVNSYRKAIGTPLYITCSTVTADPRKWHGETCSVTMALHDTELNIMFVSRDRERNLYSVYIDRIVKELNYWYKPSV